MRRADQDGGALIGEYVTARLAATAAALVGPAHARHYAERQAFLRFVTRRRPDLGPALERVLSAIAALPARISPAEAIRHVDDLENILDELTHDT